MARSRAILRPQSRTRADGAGARERGERSLTPFSGMGDGPAQHTGSEAPPARLPGTAGPNGERAMCLAPVDRAGLDPL